jgi:uncharacterized membrane protein
MPESIAAAEEPADGRRLTIYVYGFQLLGLLLVFPPVLGFAINYWRHDHVRGSPLYASHFSWQMRTFWWMVGVGGAAGTLMAASQHFQQPMLALIGGSTLLLASLWFTYRVVRGYIALCADRPMPVKAHSVPGIGDA